MGIWDFVINLSGSDLPIRDIDDLAAALARERGKNLVCSYYSKSSAIKAFKNIWGI